MKASRKYFPQVMIQRRNQKKMGRRSRDMINQNSHLWVEDLQKAG